MSKISGEEENYEKSSLITSIIGNNFEKLKEHMSDNS